MLMHTRKRGEPIRISDNIQVRVAGVYTSGELLEFATFPYILFAKTQLNNT